MKIYKSQYLKSKRTIALSHLFQYNNMFWYLPTYLLIFGLRVFTGKILLITARASETGSFISADWWSHLSMSCLLDVNRRFSEWGLTEGISLIASFLDNHIPTEILFTAFYSEVKFNCKSSDSKFLLNFATNFLTNRISNCF